ncbi:hypothetical protein D9611_011693 [Ephemerocybe angulata]|uniref:Uncharacterized protein n=1 Tax=Ephemerocybe angulata TaxID=980116 RepID=A0A8H5C6D8_9AGAR|nr:hypothetical protein D9611_011693 [Tulosesus angulatus]
MKDIIALLVQGAGGGLAATASSSTTSNPKLGSNILLGGIVFQLAVICVFSGCTVEYLVRYFTDHALRSAIDAEGRISKRGVCTTRIKVMLAGLAFNTVVLFIRAVYRTIELADGWGGRIISTELYFIVLDGVMVLLTMYSLNFIHPWWFLFMDSPKNGLYEGSPTWEESTIRLEERTRTE